MESSIENASSSLHQKEFHESFTGNTIPGTFFFCFGLWWCISALHRYFKAQLTSGRKRFVSSSTYPCVCCCSTRLKRAPLEAIFKIIACVICMAIEGVGFWRGDVTRMQHFTIYVFFGFSGVIDLGMKYRALGGSIPFPAGHVILGISFLVEGLLFQFHDIDRPPVSVILHTLLVYCCYITAAVIFLESKFCHSISLSLSRGLLSLIQGTWLWQVGSIIFPIGEEKWNLHSARCSATAIVLFSWHILSNILLVCICATAMHQCSVLKTNSHSHCRLQLEDEQNDSSLKIVSTTESKEDHIFLL